MNGYGVADLTINPFITNTYPCRSLPHSGFVQLTSRPKKFHIATPAKHGVNYQDFHKLNFIARFKFIFQTQQTDRDPKSLHRIHTPTVLPTPKKKKTPGAATNFIESATYLPQRKINRSSQQTRGSRKWQRPCNNTKRGKDEEENKKVKHQTLTPMSIKP
jgi:hypothetical protein